jgi:hypothetical protein
MIGAYATPISVIGAYLVVLWLKQVYDWSILRIISATDSLQGMRLPVVIGEGLENRINKIRIKWQARQRLPLNSRAS